MILTIDPVAITSIPESGKTITSISLGNYHSAAIDNDGNLYTWGYNSNGQLGNNAKEDSLSPVCLTTTTFGDPNYNPLYGKTIASIALGGTHSAAIDDSGDLYTWGLGASGQLGNNGTADSHIAVSLSASGGPFYEKAVTSISLGGSHSGAIAGGSLYLWGLGEYGQLGNDDTISSTYPVEISAVANPASLSLGGSHSGALNADGQLYAWGYAGAGRLGAGDEIQAQVPLFLGSPRVLSFVDQLFTYRSCDQYDDAYAALNGGYAAMTAYEKGQLGSTSRLDYARSSWDGKSYADGSSKSESVTALAKWTLVSAKAGHPLSSVVMAGDNVSSLIILSVSTAAVLAIGASFVIVRKKNQA